MTELITNHRFTKLPYLVVAHILILLGYSLNKGLFFHQAQLWLLALGWLVLLLPLLKHRWLDLNFKLQPLNLLLIANLISFILFYFFDGGIYLVSAQAVSNIFLLKFIALFLFLFYLVNFDFKGSNFFSAVLLHLKKRKFVYLAALAILLRLAIIFYSPAPKIDLFWFLDGGANSLIIGSDPYNQEFVNVYSNDECQMLYNNPNCKNNHYTYLPGSLIATSFFKVLFGDVRMTYVFAIFATVAIIYFLLRKRFRQIPEIAELVSLLILYLPLGLFVLEQSWVDQLLVFFLYIFVFLNLYNLSAWPYVSLGVIFSIKQTAWILFPFIFKLKDFDWKRFILMIAVFIFITTPFFIWDYKSFIEDTVIHHLTYQVPLFSLTFNSLVKATFYTDIPLIVSLPLLLLLLIFLFIKTKNNLFSVIHSSILFMFAVFLTKQGFTNYYYSISCGIILLIMLELYYSQTKAYED